MYKVIVVDDEIWALKSIVSTFPWAEYDFEVVCTSTNAVQVPALIEEYRPDAVFTDVCMPVINGIELMKRTKHMEKMPQFVFISGYDDYEFMRQVIINRAFDYCLKPIEQQNAKEVLARLKNFLDGQEGYSEGQNFAGAVNRITSQEFKQMVEYINGHLTEKLYLKELAGQFYLNERYCCRLFNKYFHMSFSRYLNIQRIEIAAALLLEDRTLSINDVAERSGYTNYTHFIKVFKIIKGMSPSQYRKNH